MTRISPRYSAVGLGNRPSPPQRAGAPSPVVPGKPRFAGDAFLTYHQLQAEAAQKKKEDELKAICNTVAWQKGNQSWTVGDMVVHLCFIRRDEKDARLGTIENLAKDFPNINTEALERGFHWLYANGYLNKKGDGQKEEFSLSPKGENLLQKKYPGITLPAEKNRFTRGY